MKRCTRLPTHVPLPGRLTLGLYNCYDPKQWHDIMRITLARVGPVALAFEADVATFGFPFDQARRRGAFRTEALRTEQDVVEFVASGTSIGEGGEHFAALAAAGRFRMHPFPGAGRQIAQRAALTGPGGFPVGLGSLVATTPSPDPAKAVTPLDVARALAGGEPQLLLFGLGPRGLPPEVLAAAPRHLEATGKGISMETATALGAIPALLAAHLQHLVPAPPGPAG